MFSRWLVPLVTAVVVIPACVTINVYFPAAAAEQAADRIIQDVLGAADESAVDPAAEANTWQMPNLLDLLAPAAHAQDQANIDISSPQIQAITQRMAQRQRQQLATYFANGAIGFGNDGLVMVRDRTAVGLAQRRQLDSLITEENNDRKALYREIAVANGHPEWEGDIRDTFAQRWVANAPAGWYYQNSAGHWVKK